MWSVMEGDFLSRWHSIVSVVDLRLPTGRYHAIPTSTGLLQWLALVM